ncbi:MAG: glycosyltransferase [Parcubacteria group bacterium]|nr:glycosyltransferase [Parcubacteria group bacterium]
MKLALVHDHLNQIGGAERVLSAMHEVFPRAPLYTLVHDRRIVGNFFNSLPINTSFIQKMPFSRTRLRWYLAAMPAAIESFNLSKYDVVLSSASAFAKGAIAPAHAIHICYCHTPTRYLWSDSHTYVSEVGGGRIISAILPFVLQQLRMWDYVAAQRVDRFIANSQFVARRIKRYYNRESTVIYPPVDVHRYPDVAKLNYFALVSRLRPYKKVDIAIRAFNRLNMPLVIMGDGQERKRLESIAGPNIHFTGTVDERAKKRLLAGALGFIHPQEEDLGISAIEAMAAGTPVVAYQSGGACETVRENETGVFFEEQTWQSLADAVIRFRRQRFDYGRIRAHARQFSRERFQGELKNFVTKAYENRH